MKKGTEDLSTVGKVLRIAEPVAEKLGLELWDVKYVKEGTSWYLRIFIDKEGGVTIDDCEIMSKTLDPYLDEYDPVVQSYCLEVCSPGINRELVKIEHFERFKSKKVKVRLIRPYENGEKHLEGILLGFDGTNILLEDEESNTIKLNKKDIVRVNLNGYDSNI